MSEVREYISVNEKEFWEEKTLELTIKWRVLDSDLQDIVNSKINNLNTKIDTQYDVSLFDKWEQKLSSHEAKVLSDQLKDVINGFNQEIERIESEYIWSINENRENIQNEISNYFSDKSLFIKKWVWLAAIWAYASMSREDALPYKEKELSLD